MIVPELKEIYSRDIFVGLHEYIPENKYFFEIDLILVIGVKGENGGDIFYLTVCSSSSISEVSKNCHFLSKDGYLIVDEYDFFNIKKIIEDYLSTIAENNWEDVAKRINCFAKWEFDNYQNI